MPLASLGPEISRWLSATQKRAEPWVTRLKSFGGTRSHVWTRWVYLRLLGLTSLVALGSLGAQLTGLIGQRGLWPAADQLKRYPGMKWGEALHQLPTLAWIDSSDAFLSGLVYAGLCLSVLVAVGVVPRLSLALLWVVWLSLVAVGGPFLSFQWDVLLLEALLLGVLFAPWTWFERPWREAQPSAAALFLQRWLIFRLMLLSGLVKLLSGDPTWRELTAFRYHYWTQPLPTWTSHYAHHLPDWLHTASCAAMFVVELVLPFLVFGPRQARLWAFGGFAGLQLVLMATGNYSYFNLLSLVLCVPLLDDGALVPARWAKASMNRRVSAKGSVASWAAAALLVTLSVHAFARRLIPASANPGLLETAMAWFEPLRSVNSYGAFAVMTRTRPEIVVEGSRDGVSFKPYVFRFKPGEVTRAPTFVAPLQPRLDWQMWFAALGRCEQSPWFHQLLRRLLEGSPPVLALFESDPFPEGPPKWVRSTVWQYRFSSPEERAAGVWWVRQEQGPFCPTVTLEAGRLVRMN